LSGQCKLGRSISQGTGPNNSYNANKIRFPAPVPAGARVRARAEIVSVDDAGGDWRHSSQPVLVGVKALDLELPSGIQVRFA
jgi:acyl dehydratase